jgi:Flp pilus assembly protein TadD
LADVQRAYMAKDVADAAFARGDLETGSREYERAQSLAPRNVEFSFWHGIAMLRAGRIDEAVGILRPVFTGDRNWATLALRMTGSQFLPGDPSNIRNAIAKAQKG